MDKISRALPGTPLGHTKAAGFSEESSHHSSRRRKNEFGLVGLINVGNSCYMNATLQALSNCPPFRQYFLDCHHAGSHLRAADALSLLFRQIWISERNPGHLSPRKVSSVMKNRTFRGSLQQDAQEFLRCLLSQIHEEIGLVLPEGVTCGCGQQSCDCLHRHSSVSCVSHDSNGSSDSTSVLVRSASSSPVTPKRKISGSPAFSLRRKNSAYRKLKGSLDKLPFTVQAEDGTTGSLVWKDGDCFEADLKTGLVTLHSPEQDRDSLETSEAKKPTNTQLESAGVPQLEKSSEDVAAGTSEIQPAPNLDTSGSSVDPTTPVVLREKPDKKNEKRRVVSIVSQVFEGVLESKVTCSACKKVSVIHEPFHDLSLPIPGRTEMDKFNRKHKTSSETEQREEEEEREPSQSRLNRGFCKVLKIVSHLTQDLIRGGPPTDLRDCLNAFFDACELKGDNKYFCSHCKSFQTSRKQTSVVRLPEVLCVHLKRFRFDSYLSSKISRHITFPLSDLDMGPFMKDKKAGPPDKYQLDALITHIGGAGGGHYVAYAHNSHSSSWHEFNDTRVHRVGTDTVEGAEGYVLFYSRTPPADSLSAHSLDISSILPDRGTTLPSPDVCYLSRHWLHLARHCAHPGPIFQYEYACAHGGVVRPETAKQMSVTIKRSVWEEFQSRFGGGPLVSRLEPCSECLESGLFRDCPYNLEQLNSRRTQERDKVFQLQQSERSAKTECILVSKSWVQKWQGFIKASSLDVSPPGPVDNTTLLTQENHTLKLVDQTSYRKVTLPVWKFFHETYGGGPLITISLNELFPMTTV